MSTLRNSLRRIEEAFIQGVARPEGDVDEWRKLYGPIVIAAVESHLPADENDLVNRCTMIGNEALQATRANDDAAARRGFDEAWSLYRAHDISREAQLHIEARLDPMEAYLDYRLRKNELARERITRASAKDEILVQEFGYGLLGVHRLQLALNLLRIDAQQSGEQAAVHLGAALLDYIEHCIESLDRSIVSARETLDTLDERIVHAYFDKVAGELLLAQHDPALFAPLAHHAEACRHSRCGTHAHAVIAARAARLAHSDGFVHSAAELLAAGRQAQPLLWFAVVVDAIAFCRRTGRDGQRVALRLIGDALSQRDAPGPLRHAIEQSERSLSAIRAVS